MTTIPQRLREIAVRIGTHDMAAYVQLRAIAAELEAPAADAVPVVAWQGGLDNEQLRAAFKRKLPAVDPTDRDLTCFALGVEVGESIDASAWNRLHHVLKKHGLHPGRTDDDIIDITDAAIATVSALQEETASLRQQLADLADRQQYKGNSVSFIYQKKDAYASAIDKVFDVLGKHGHKADGSTHVADLTNKALCALQARIDELEARWNLCSACNAELGGSK